MSITVDDLKGAIQAISDKLSAEKDNLNKLDSALGDGDHGTGISTGFSAVVEVVADAQSPAEVLKLTATTLMNRMGGSSGALFGTLFLKAALYIKDKATISEEDFVIMFQNGCKGVAQRGKSQVGDKTMLDALSPAIETLEQKVSEGASLASALTAAADAAQTGAQSTEKMQAKHGRAKYVGERAIGHRDAGAQSVALIFVALANYWEDKKNA